MKDSSVAFGLSWEVIQKITKTFKEHPYITKVILYGSRAKGNYRDGSDIDLAIFSDKIELQQLHKIELELDELMLPYQIDLCIYNTLQNKELKEHIDRVGKVVYQRTPEEIAKS